MFKLPGWQYEAPRDTNTPVFRGQQLKYVCGVAGPFEAPKNSSMTPRDTVPVMQLHPNSERQPVNQPVVGPAWLVHDRRVLRFYAFFKESVLDRVDENWRVRKVVIFFYLEDGSLQVAEPKEENSGLVQGQLLRRHRVPKVNLNCVSSPNGSPSESLEFVGVADLKVGNDVTIYGVKYSICACDASTRQFLLAEGIGPVPLDQPYPVGPVEAARQKDAHHQPRPPKVKSSAHSLTNEGKVLRFFATWDDTKACYGDLRPYVLHYFLSDDSVEVLEVVERNSGRDPFPKLLKRQKLPVEVSGVGARPASEETRRRRHEHYYHWTDLGIGKTINVFGRNLLLHDWDDFTMRHYHANT